MKTLLLRATVLPLAAAPGATLAPSARITQGQQRAQALCARVSPLPPW